MNTGYVKLWRKTLKSPVWQNPKLFRFWAWCLMKASHKERVALVGFQKVPLVPGQFIFGRKKAAAETGLSEKSVRTCLECLKTLENVTIKTASKYSILTVVNWDFYQEYQTEGASKRASKGPAKGQQRATDKHVKNEKKKYSCAFNEFWSAYPKKKAKADAWKAWQQADIPEDIVSIVERHKSNNHDWQKENGQYIPLPASWIRGCRWEDDLGPAQSKRDKLLEAY
jgi:hypothetical protein